MKNPYAANERETLRERLSCMAHAIEMHPMFIVDNEWIVELLDEARSALTRGVLAKEAIIDLIDASLRPVEDSAKLLYGADYKIHETAETFVRVGMLYKIKEELAKC